MTDPKGLTTEDLRARWREKGRRRQERLLDRLGAEGRRAHWRAKAPAYRPVEHEPRPCETCRADFVPANARQRYCRPSHQPRRPITRACSVCGTEFQALERRTRTCSLRCGQLARRPPGASCAVPWASCRECSSPIVARGRTRLRCIDCRPASGPTLIVQRCSECGESFTASRQGRRSSSAQYCKRACCLRASRRNSKHRRRTIERAGVRVDRIAVFERDDWRCWICGDAVDRDAVAPDLASPTIDHVIPLSRGGRHAPDNVRTAHWICNTLRGAPEVAAA